MRMFLALSSLFAVMVLVQAGPLCPYPPATVDCDMCELLMAGDSSFMQNCGNNFSPDMIDSIGTDCGTYQKNGQVEDFLKNMHLICDQKNQPFEDPICECTMCSQLLASTSSFMQNCGKHLSADLLDSIKLDCVMYEDANAFDDFLKNMHLICDEKDTPFDDPPPCNCTICGLLLDPASSFMKNCGQHLSADLLDSIRTDCVMYEDAGEVDAFLENMHLICDEKNNSFDDPQCECDVCKELLDEESSFMVNCGQHLSVELLESIRADCAMYDENEEVDEFLKNMHLICDEKEYPFNDPCECLDDLCMLMFLPNSDFMKKCGHLFSLEEQKKMYADCKEHKCDGWYEGSIEQMCREKGAPSFEYPKCGEPCALYPFGEVLGDSIGPNCDDCAIRIDLDNAMTFLGVLYDYIYICANGFLSFGDGGGEAIHWSECAYRSTTDVDMFGVMPFWTDNNVAKDPKSHIWYRESTNEILLKKAKNLVNANFDSACSSGFEAESLFIATWYLVKPYTNFTDDYYEYYYICEFYWSTFCETHAWWYTDEVDTFQVVFINGGDGSELYVLYIYDQIEWIESWGIYPVVGISDGPGYHIPWPPHNYYGAEALKWYSNIGHDGCWAYKVSGSHPEDPECNPPPEKEWFEEDEYNCRGHNGCTFKWQ